MAAMQDLVEEVERSFAETQERLSDPSVYNDHREAAEVGRRLKELEAAHRLATEWLEASSDLEAARGDGDLRELVPELEERVDRLEQDLKLALVESDPADRKDVIAEIRQASGVASSGSNSVRARTRPAASRASASRSRATAPTRSSSGRAAPTASSGCR